MGPTVRFTWRIRVIVVGPLKVIRYASRNRWTAKKIIIIITSRHRATLIDKFYYHYFSCSSDILYLYNFTSRHRPCTTIRHVFEKYFSNPRRSRVNPSHPTGRRFLFIRLCVRMRRRGRVVVVTGIVTCDIIQ